MPESSIHLLHTNSDMLIIVIKAMFLRIKPPGMQPGLQSGHLQIMTSDIQVKSQEDPRRFSCCGLHLSFSFTELQTMQPVGTGELH